MVAPLEGIRVLELTSWMAAPSAAAVLSDLGADVVKVEPLAGDAARGMVRPPRVQVGGETVDASFHFDNRGKKSIAVALDRPEGAALVQKLAADVDVLVINQLPHRQAKYGLDKDSLFKVNRRLVHATLTGYGTTGPEASRPGYDVTAFFGRGGVFASLIEPGGEPPQARPAQGDHTTALSLVIAVLTGLRLRDQTGEPQAVETSLFHSAVWSMASDIVPTLVDHYQPSVRTRRNSLGALANRFPCAEDRWFIFNMPEPYWWARFCAAVERPDLAEDPRLQTPKGRFENMPELVDTLDEMFRTKTIEEWGAIFDANGLIWGPAQRVIDIVDDPQARAAGFFSPIQVTESEAIDTVTVPFKVAGVDINPRGPAPSLGQHTRDVLGGLGLSDDELDRLKANGIIG